ncbi:MAG: ectoine utilization protein EutA [Sneathiella sp.]|nr:ectoine utilization protein EutA [Sneathiella sp.]
MSVQIQNPDIFRVELDARPVPKRIGLIVLATDHTSERDFARLCDPDEVGVYVNRIEYENPTTPENLRLTGPRLTAAAALMLPGEDLDVIAFSCTAASVVLGDDAVAEYIHAAKPKAHCVTPVNAAFAAFKALDIQRISILTPYSREVTDELAGYFSKNGPEVINADCLGFDDDREMARIKPESIVAAGERAIQTGAEALFISCTALRSLVCVEELERRIGKPVITSNQATIWRSLRLSGVNRPIQGYGRLFTK